MSRQQSDIKKVLKEKYVPIEFVSIEPEVIE